MYYSTDPLDMEYDETWATMQFLLFFEPSK